MHPERLVHFLEVIAVIGRPISATKALRANELPKPTCDHSIQTLQQQGLTKEANNGGRYVVSERLIRIALMGKSDVDALRVAAAFLKVVLSNLSETVLLASFCKHKAEITRAKTPDNPSFACIHLGLGESLKHAYSFPKAIAALAEERLQNKILQGSLQVYTDHTKATREDQFSEFNAIGQQDFADYYQKIDIDISSGVSRITTENIAATFSACVVEPVSQFCRNIRYNFCRRLTHLVTKVNGAIKLCKVAQAQGKH